MTTRRIVTKIGDIFSVTIDERCKKYFQLITHDSRQLNSDVIRVFKEKYPISATPDFSEIVKGEVEFYAHCITKFGVKLGYWQKVGKANDVGEFDHVLFRDTMEYGRKAGEEPIMVSNKWHVWRIGDAHFTDVGKLEGENRRAEIGLVINPKSIVNRIKTGKYDFPFYPNFE